MRFGGSSYKRLMGECTGDPVCAAIKASWRSRSIAPLIPNLSRRSEWLTLLSSRYTPANNSDTHCCVLAYMQMAMPVAHAGNS